ncbi:carbon monoxide dehydrogenase [Marinobacter sp. R17]|uniref:FAD binding domain-containing protein n=1 Tax=Marinobacter sp. R17 TaxID=2484250 RepID=UPI000F4C6CE0|nr:FAD binding domain-containing protein [Marinobacter sp. R17]ROT99937.1 carbon monoxide dehydrogenase [Marinobacter sp. R17]
MKPAAFEYIRPGSRREVCELLHSFGDDARIIAGGQSLMAVLNMRFAQPKVLIDIAGIDDLRYIQRRRDYLAVGAGITQAELMEYPALVDEVPLLAQAMPWIGHAQTRNRGTVCGSVAHADPSAELPLCLTALGGDVVLESRRGKSRQVPAQEFFQGVLTTAKRADELLTEVRFPLRRQGESYRFREVSMRHGDFAIVALAASVSGDRADLSVGGVADRPVRRSLPLDEKLRASLNEFAWSLNAQDDAHASAIYRRHLVRELGFRLVNDCSTEEDNFYASQS